MQLLAPSRLASAADNNKQLSVVQLDEHSSHKIVKFTIKKRNLKTPMIFQLLFQQIHSQLEINRTSLTRRSNLRQVYTGGHCPPCQSFAKWEQLGDSPGRD